MLLGTDEPLSTTCLWAEQEYQHQESHLQVQRLWEERRTGRWGSKVTSLSPWLKVVVRIVRTRNPRHLNTIPLLRSVENTISATFRVLHTLMVKDDTHNYSFYPDTFFFNLLVRKDWSSSTVKQRKWKTKLELSTQLFSLFNKVPCSV